MGRVARAAAQQREDRPPSAPAGQAGGGGSGRSSASGQSITKTPSGRRCESVAQQHRLGGHIADHRFRQRQLAAPARQACCKINAQARRGHPAPAPGGHHAVADLDRPLRARRPVESDVTHHLAIDDDLMDPPGRRLLDSRPSSLRWAANTIAIASMLSSIGYSGCQRLAAPGALRLAQDAPAGQHQPSHSDGQRHELHVVGGASARPAVNLPWLAAMGSSGSLRGPWSAASSPAPAFPRPGQSTCR